MSHDDSDSDNASIVPVPSISSDLSGIWPKIPSSSRQISLAIFDMCSYIDLTPDADDSPIKQLVVRKEEDGFRHEFLLLLLAKPQSGEEFWVRLERKGPPRIPLAKLSYSALDANDIVSVVIDLY